MAAEVMEAPALDLPSFAKADVVVKDHGVEAAKDIAFGSVRSTTHTRWYQTKY